MMQDNVTYLNGEFVSASEAAVPVGDRGLTLGDGVFDTMLAIDGKPVWPKEHFARLAYSASVMKIDFTLDFEKTALELLNRNHYYDGRHAVRTTITRGQGTRGLAPPDHAKPAIIMTAGHAPVINYRAELIIAQTVRRNEHSPLSQIKSLNYGDNILAIIEAREKDAEDALMLNTDGNVCCTTAGNIFIREGDTLITPPLSDGVLAGTTRQKIIAAHNAREESFTPERLFEADAVFLTNSIKGVRSVKRVDHTYFREHEDDAAIVAELAA